MKCKHYTEIKIIDNLQIKCLFIIVLLLFSSYKWEIKFEIHNCSVTSCISIKISVGNLFVFNWISNRVEKHQRINIHICGKNLTLFTFVLFNYNLSWLYELINCSVLSYLSKIFTNTSQLSKCIYDLNNHNKTHKFNYLNAILTWW